MSLSTTNLMRENLNPNKNTMATPYVNDNGIDMFSYPDDFEKCSDFVELDYDVMSNPQTYSRNSTTQITFEVPVQQFDRLGKMVLLIEREALTASGVAFEDWEAYAVINSWEVKYLGKTLHRISGAQRVQDILDKESPEEIKKLARLGNGNLTYRERLLTFGQAYSNSDTSQTALVFDPKVPWESISKSLNLFSLPSPIQVVVRFNTFANSCFNPSSSAYPSETAGNMKATLRVTGYCLPDKYNQETYSRIQTTGIAAKILTQQRQDVASLSPNFISATMKFDSITGNVVSLRSYLIAVKNQDDEVYRNGFLFIPHNLVVRDSSSAIMPTQLWGHSDAQRSRITPNYPYHKVKNGADCNPHKKFIDSFTSTKIFFCPPKYWLASEDGCYGSRFLMAFPNANAYLVPGSYANTDPCSTATGKLLFNGRMQRTAVAETNIRWYIIADIHNLLIQRQGEIFLDKDYP